MGTITELQVDIRSEMFNGQTVHDALILRAIGEAIDAIQYAVGADGKPILWDWLKTTYSLPPIINLATLSLSGVSPAIKEIDYIELFELFIDSGGDTYPVTYMLPESFFETYRYGGSNALPVAYTVEGTTLTWGPTPNLSYSGRIVYYQRHAITGSTTILVPDLELVKRGAKMRVALDQDNAEVAKMNLDIYDRLFANLMARQQRFEIPRYTVPVY